MIAFRLSLLDYESFASLAASRDKTPTGLAQLIISTQAVRHRGADGPTTPTTAQRAPIKRMPLPEGPTMRIQYELPTRTVRDFRAYAVANGIDVRHMMMQAMDSYITQHMTKAVLAPSTAVTASTPPPSKYVASLPQVQAAKMAAEGYSPEVAAGLSELDNELGLEN